MSNFILLAAAYLIMKKKKIKKKAWKNRLTLEGRRRRDRRYPRCSLRLYHESPFHHLFTCQNDQALLNACGVDHDEFHRLLQLFQPHFDECTFNEKTGEIYKKKHPGRRRSIDAVGALGMVLMWYRTKGPLNRSFPLIFGLTNTPMERWLLFAKVCLLQALVNYKPTMPSGEQCEEYVKAICDRYPHVGRVAFAADGLKMSIHPPTDYLKQQKFYNGWKHGHYITNIIVFAPDGSIPCCALNAPGCLHDSTIADYGGVYNKLESVYKKYNVKTVIDSAFSLTLGKHLIKSSQLDPMDRALALQNQQATSVRQLSEWGMRQIQAKFPRMTDSLRYEEQGGRLLDLKLMIRLYNHSVERIGMNQILDTYMPEKSPERCYYLDAGHSIDNDANNVANTLIEPNLPS
jgi:DDE superfamily endonuclease